MSTGRVFPGPVATVCIPTFNGGRYLLRAVRSTLAQDVPGLSVVVVDDGSTDGSLASLATISDPRLRIVKNERNAGMVANWNRCLEHASGGYVLLFHQDDELLPGGLSRLLDALDEAPEAGFAFGGIATIDGSGNTIGGHWARQSLPPAGLLSGHDVVRRLAARGNFIPCPTVLARLNRIRKVGRFDPALAYTPDLFMWLRLAARWDVVFVEEPVALLRRHAGQASTRFIGSPDEVAEVRKAFERFFDEEGATIAEILPECKRLHRIHLRKWAAAQARRALADHRPAAAARILLEGWR